jgi:uncharacterized membrane protein YphA (DoxX/SURF4 family)
MKEKAMATTHMMHSGTALTPATEGQILHSVQTMLRIAFGVVPIVAGLDKFTNILTQWEQYLNPAFLRIVPMSGAMFMHVVGVIEIIAGVIVLAKPRLGAFIVMAWLWCIALQLLAGWMYADVAVRDLTMSLGAIALARLTPIAEAHDVAATI